jgi:trans-aconitate methyltransferase
MYKAEIISGNHTNRESLALYEHAISVLNDLIEKCNVRQVVNFGVSYAHVDSVLARKMKDVKFVGVDRSKAIKQLNEEESKFENISFISGDIMGWINTQKDLNNTLFYSMRTCVLLPQVFIEKLYKKLAEKNCYLIVGFEPFGLSRSMNSLYEQTKRKKESAIFRDIMYLHNYLEILNSNGYEMKRIEYVKTAHIDKDYRIQSFTAQMLSASEEVEAKLSES